MLDQLRAMGIFACVVRQNSFSGAARELGITTSAVSQQIRSLEQEIAATLLFRSTRKISLTEAGQVFFLSCKEMLDAAERGKKSINELRDDLIGNLKITANADLMAHHVIPALSHWMETHQGLNVQFEVTGQDHLFYSTPDIALGIRLKNDAPLDGEIVLTDIEQLLVASPNYLQQHTAITNPIDLQTHVLYPDTAVFCSQPLFFKHIISDEKAYIDMPKRQVQNHISVVKSLCLNGLGLSQMLSLDAQKEFLSGQLNIVLPDWKLPQYTLYAVVADPHSIRVQRCLEVLKTYFDRVSGRKFLKEAS